MLCHAHHNIKSYNSINLSNALPCISQYQIIKLLKQINFGNGMPFVA